MLTSSENVQNCDITVEHLDITIKLNIKDGCPIVEHPLISV